MSTTSSKNNKSHEEIKAFWTKEVRDSAKPKPFPIPPDSEDAKIIHPKKPIITPSNMSVKEVNRDFEVDLGIAVPEKSPQILPWRCNGKLFFKWRGENWVGSASSILLEVLLTAAHNVYDDGEWSSDFYYHPGYPDFDGQKKKWSWSRAAIFNAWKDNKNLAFDYAMILTDTPMTGIGSIGCARNISPKNRSWTAIGYPAKPPYPGNQMYKTTGEYVKGSSIITMDHNDMTQGSSGGAWLTKIKGETYVNGVQSTRGGAFNQANSPYIDDDDYKKLLNCVQTDVCN